MADKIIYIKAEQSIEINRKEVLLSDIAKVLSPDPVLSAKVKGILIHKFGDVKKAHCVISIMKLIELIQQMDEKVNVQSVGENDIVISYFEGQKNRVTKTVFKVTFVTFIAFFGTAFTIMAFHNDIGIRSLFQGIYEKCGLQSEGAGVLEIFYSIGLALGITVFFNHVGKKNITTDPTPIEVEMHVYEKDINTTWILDASKKGDEIDVM